MSQEPTEGITKRKDFFISYASTERQWAEWIAWQLEEVGYSTVIQAWDFHAGGNFVLDMDMATRQAERTIAVLSSDYFASRFTRAEWAATFRQDPTGERGLLLPIRVRPCDVEGLLGPIVYIDLVGQEEQAVRTTLLASVQYHRGKPVHPPAFPYATQGSPKQPAFPGKFPAIWNLPYPRNPYFTGREELLTQLAMKLQAGQATAISQPQAISGLGGIGKTQLALEYAYRHSQDYEAVIWVRADTREALISGFVDLATLFKLPERYEQDQWLIVYSVKEWFQTHDHWLFLLDNADELDLVREFLPPIGRGGHLLLTTRAQSMGRLAQRLEVDVLDQEVGTLFLLRRSGKLDQASTTDVDIAHQIMRELGGLPLALDQAGAYIEEMQCSLSDYLHLYRAHRADLLKERGGHIPDHPEPVATTWSLSFQKVQQSSSAAADLLYMCAFLYPEAIPEEIFMKGALHLGSRLRVVATDPLAFNRIVNCLARYSLLRRDAVHHQLTIHRLVQAVIKDSMKVHIQKRWAKRVVLALSSAFPSVDIDNREIWRPYLPHAEDCAVLIEQYDFTLFEAAHLLHCHGLALYYLAQYKQAEPLYQQALHIKEEILGPNHPETAATLHELAQLYQAQGKYEQAEPLYQQALAIREQALEPNHPHLAVTLHELARLYRAQSKYGQAELLYQQALHIKEEIWGPNHPETAATLHELARLYLTQWKYEQAESLFQRALRIEEGILGPDHLQTAATLLGLATLYQVQGKYEQAELLYQRAMAIHVEVQSEHPTTAAILGNLAWLYVDLGKYEQAELLYQRALAIYQKALGPKHPAVAAILDGLATLYQGQGKYEQIESLHKCALDICEKVLGPEHPKTASSLKHLATLYRAQGKYEQAEPLYQRALDICEKVLGPEHPKTASCLKYLAMLYHDLGKYEWVEPLYLRTLAIHQKVLGLEHPNTVSSLGSLATLYRDLGKYEQAEPLYLRTLEISERVLGQEHPGTATILNNLAALYYAQSKYPQTELLYQRALAIRTKVLGSEHPATLATLGNLALLYHAQGKYEQAEPLYQRTLAIYETLFGLEHPHIAIILEHYAAMLREMKRFEEAISFEARVNVLQAKPHL